MIVTIFTLLFPPDMGGGATRALNIAKCLANQGHEVRVITSLPHYPEGLSIRKSFHVQRENMEGIEVTRLPILGMPHRGLMNRFVIYGWFALLSVISLRICCGSRRIISLGPHPFTELPAYLAKIVTKSTLIVDVSDLWPETWAINNYIVNVLFQGLGYSFNKIVLGHLSDKLSIFNERALGFLVRRYDINKQCVVLYNSVDTNAFVHHDSAKARKENLKAILGRDIESWFVVLYHGVIGPYQRIDTIVDAASIEEKRLGKALFVIVGEGEQKERVVRYARLKGNRNVVFLPRMNREQMRRIVVESDLGLVPIVYKQDLLIYVVTPVKATEFLASGTPVLVPKGSYIAKIVTQSQAGFEVDFSDPMSIFKAIEKAATDSETYELMAKQARKVAVDRFSLDRANEAIRSIIT